MSSENIWEKGVLINLDISVWGARKSLDKSLIETDADKEFISATKHLINVEELKEIWSLANRIRAYVNDKSLPFPIHGVQFIPKDLILEVDNRLKEFKNKFGVSWNFVMLSSPSSMSVLSPEFYEREKEKFKQTIDEFKEMAVSAVAEKFQELLNHIIERLQEGAVFKNSSIEKIREFVDNIDKINITDNQELKQYTEQIKSILNNNPVDCIRKYSAVREQVKKSMEIVKTEIDKMLKEAPVRKILED